MSGAKWSFGEGGVLFWEFGIVSPGAALTVFYLWESAGNEHCRQMLPECTARSENN